MTLRLGHLGIFLWPLYAVHLDNHLHGVVCRSENHRLKYCHTTSTSRTASSTPAHSGLKSRNHILKPHMTVCYRLLLGMLECESSAARQNIFVSRVSFPQLTPSTISLYSNHLTPSYRSLLQATGKYIF